MAIIGWAGGWFGQEQRVIACLNVQRHALPTAYSLMRACWENCVLALACWGTKLILLATIASSKLLPKVTAVMKAIKEERRHLICYCHLAHVLRSARKRSFRKSFPRVGDVLAHHVALIPAVALCSSLS